MFCELRHIPFTATKPSIVEIAVISTSGLFHWFQKQELRMPQDDPFFLKTGTIINEHYWIEFVNVCDGFDFLPSSK